MSRKILQKTSSLRYINDGTRESGTEREPGMERPRMACSSNCETEAINPLLLICTVVWSIFTFRSLARKNREPIFRCGQRWLNEWNDSHGSPALRHSCPMTVAIKSWSSRTIFNMAVLITITGAPCLKVTSAFGPDSRLKYIAGTSRPYAVAIFVVTSAADSIQLFWITCRLRHPFLKGQCRESWFW